VDVQSVTTVALRLQNATPGLQALGRKNLSKKIIELKFLAAQR
jgi:hypothetical protein